MVIPALYDTYRKAEKQINNLMLCCDYSTYECLCIAIEGKTLKIHQFFIYNVSNAHILAMAVP